MSIRFNGNASNFLSRTTSLPDYNAAYTIMAWIKLKVDRNANSTFFNLATATANNFDIGQFTSDGTTLVIASRIGGTINSDSGSSLSVDAWRHVTMRRASISDVKLFLDFVEDAAYTLDVTGRAAQDAFNIGRTNVNNFTGEPLDAEMAYLRVWTTDLTTAEIEAERDSVTAVKTANLYGDYPMATGATAGDDVSGQSHPFTINGTITTGASEPLIGGSLVIQNASHAHTAQNIDIDTGIHNLVIQNATHAHTAQNISFANLFSDCMAAWKLEDLVDATGGGHTLTNNNAVTFGAGKIGNSANFVAASSQNLTLANHPHVSPGDTDWTIGFWVKMTDLSATYKFVAKDAAGGQEYYVGYNHVSLHFSFGVYVGGTEHVVHADTSVFDPDAGVDYCILVGHDSVNNQIWITVNDIATDTTATSGAPNSGTGSVFAIGSRTYSGFQEYTNGKIDAVHFWHRKLTSAQKTEFYNAGNGIEFSGPTSPTANAGFDQTRMELETVMLDSSQSHSVTDITGRVWEQVSGTPVEIINPTSINPTFIASPGPAELVFKVTVTNEDNLTNEHQVTISIVPTGSTTWLWHTPQEEGFDADEFYAAMALLPSRAMVLRNGRVIGTKADVTQEGFIWSGSKSLVALIFARLLHLEEVSYTDTVPGSDNPTSPLATFQQFLSGVRPT